MTGSYLPSVFSRNGGSLASLFKDIEKTFEDFSRRAPFLGEVGTPSPKFDVCEKDDAIEVTAELPGVDSKDVDIVLADDMLTIRGEKKVERDEKKANWHLSERSYGSFSRTIALPYEPEAAKVEATFDKGLLHVRMPKPAEIAKKERKITIKTG
jgi:HSP20 family protein